MGGFDVEGLIRLVKEHVYLYDITHKKYKDANLKAAVWDSIAQRLNRNCKYILSHLINPSVLKREKFVFRRYTYFVYNVEARRHAA